MRPTIVETQDNLCRRCFQPLDYIESSRGAVKLIGGFLTVLCLNCCNDWSELLAASENAVRYKLLEQQIKAYVSTGATSAIVEAVAESKKIGDNLFLDGKRFVNENN